MSVGTFAAFTQARLAIYASQAGIQVTGNNISNVNTPGYTRQRVEQGSLHVNGSDRYVTKGQIHIGQGVLVTGISQIRSPYLDIRFRTENAQVGYMESKLDGLDRIAMVLDEVGKGDETKDEEGFGVLAQELNNIFAALNDLTSETGHQEYDNTVRARCQSLTNKFHTYASQLEQLHEQTVEELHQNVDKVNGILDSIRSLNEEIRKSDIYGANCLELRDERNRQIDELSSMIGINVTYSMEQITAGVEVEKLTIRLGNANPNGKIDTDEALLIDGVFSAHIEIDQIPEPRDPLELAKLQDADKGATMANQDETIWPYDNGTKYTTAPYKDKVTGEDTTWPYRDKTTGEGTNWHYVNEDTGEVTNSKKVRDDWAKKNPAAKITDNLENDKNTLNTSYLGYVKPDGTYTTKKEEARTTDNPNYNMTITQLVNKVGEPHYAIEKIAPSTVAKDTIIKIPKVEKNDGTLVKNDDGTTQYTEEPKDAISVLLKKTNIVSFTVKDVPKEGDSTITTCWKVLKKDAMPDEHGKYNDDNYVFYSQTYTKTLSRTVPLDDNDLNGKLQAQRELLTEMGEFTDTKVLTADVSNKDGEIGDPCRVGDENAGSKRGIPYYQKALDLLANQFARAFNDANQGFRTDPSGNYIEAVTDADGNVIGGQPIKITGLRAGGGDEEVDKVDEDGNKVMQSDGVTPAKVKAEYTINKNIAWKNQPDGLKRALLDAVGITPIADDKMTNTGYKLNDNLEISGEDIINAYLKSQEFDTGTNEFIPTPKQPTNDDPSTTLPARGIFEGHILFSNSGANDDPSYIDASNISISHTWSTEHVLIRDFTCPVGEAEPATGASDNIRHMVYLQDQKLSYVPSDLIGASGASDEIMFKGSFYEMWNAIGDTLGQDQTKTGTMYDTHYENALEIDTSRDSLSAVDFNDEAMNLMMYSKSYNAACRLMTTIDSMIDKLVNGTGLTT